MNKIEQEIIDAIKERKTALLSKRDKVVTCDDHQTVFVFLWEHRIIEFFDRNGGIITLNSCGWKSVMTKNRMNAILDWLGYSKIYQIKGKWYWNGFLFKDGMRIAENKLPVMLNDRLYADYPDTDSGRYYLPK